MEVGYLYTRQAAFPFALESTELLLSRVITDMSSLRCLNTKQKKSISSPPACGLYSGAATLPEVSHEATGLPAADDDERLERAARHGQRDVAIALLSLSLRRESRSLSATGAPSVPPPTCSVSLPSLLLSG